MRGTSLRQKKPRMMEAACPTAAEPLPHAREWLSVVRCAAVVLRLLASIGPLLHVCGWRQRGA